VIRRNNKGERLGAAVNNPVDKKKDQKSKVLSRIGRTKERREGARDVTPG